MSQKRWRFPLAVKLAIIIMVTSLAGTGAVAYLSYLQSKEIFKQKNILTIKGSLDKYERMMLENLKVLKYNVTTLSENISVKGFLRAYHNPFGYDQANNKTLDQYKREVEALFRLILEQNPAYFQVRLIDAKSGQELVRLERDNGAIRVVPEALLQNKKQMPYVSKTIAKQGDLYVSEINLNREHGKIEYPARPTVRVAKLTAGSTKDKGVVVINADVAKLFDFKPLRQNALIRTFIVNQQGYYLLNTEAPFKEFGFELNTQYRVTDDFLKISALLQGQKSSLQEVSNRFILMAKKVPLDPNHAIYIIQHSTDTLFEVGQKTFFTHLIGYIFGIVLVIVLVTIVVVQRFTAPIRRLTHVANEIASSGGKGIRLMEFQTGDELEALAHSFNVMVDALNASKAEVEGFAKRMEVEVEEKTRALNTLNAQLQQTVKEKIAEIRKKDQALLQQNKLATIGETIGAIAHQWRQPLNSLALNIQMLVDMAENNECSVEEVEAFVEQNMKTIQFMSQTIDDFRNFFRESREKTAFDVADAIESTVSLQSEQLKNHHIQLQKTLQSQVITGYRSKFMQVILNLISNAKDAILQKQEKSDASFEGHIILRSYLAEGQVVIEVCDNGVEIPPNLQEKIFEPYFTTKKQGQGTGMGLYMSKEIIAGMDGDLSLRIKNGEKCFVITLPQGENHG